MASPEGQALFRYERLIKALEKRKTTLSKLFLPLSVLVYILTLYNIFPDSLQIAWKGRWIYAVFIWILSLELILTWKTFDTFTPFAVSRLIRLAGKYLVSFFQTIKRRIDLPLYVRVNKFKGFFNELLLRSERSPRKYLIFWFFGTIVLSLPIIYVASVYYFGLLKQVIALGRLLPITNGSFVTYHWPLSVEIMFFSLLILAFVFLMYGVTGVRRYSISLTILIGTATFYLIDTFFPYTSFYPLQVFVPVTTYTVAGLLKLVGYKVIVLYNSVLYVAGGKHLIPLIAINWPCAGVQSLLIYTLVVFLFLKNLKTLDARAPFAASRFIRLTGKPFVSFSQTIKRRKDLPVCVYVNKIKGFFNELLLRSERSPRKRLTSITTKIFYFIIGAVGTFLTNILRVFTFFWLALNCGANIGMLFHDYYGEIYFLTWLPLYFLFILCIHAKKETIMGFWEKIKGFLCSPQKTFAALEEERWNNSIIYFLKLLSIYAIAIALITTAIFSFLLPTILSLLETFLVLEAVPWLRCFLSSLNGIIPFAVFLATIVGGIVGILIGGMWIHIWVYITGGRKGVGQTLKSIAYGSTPLLLLGWIPFVGIAFGIWSILVSTKGVRQLHGISTRRVVVAYLSGAIIIPSIVLFSLYVPI